jgi:hypothetical protein
MLVDNEGPVVSEAFRSVIELEDMESRLGDNELAARTNSREVMVVLEHVDVKSSWQCILSSYRRQKIGQNKPGIIACP